MPPARLSLQNSLQHAAQKTVLAEHNALHSALKRDQPSRPVTLNPAANASTNF